MAEKEIKGIKKFLEEFKAFAMRGNVLDMAVGVVIGSAFTAIVNSLVNDMVIKTVNALHKKPAEPEAPAEPTTKVCPYCQSEIAIKAVRCPHCTTKLEGFPEIND